MSTPSTSLPVSGVAQGGVTAKKSNFFETAISDLVKAGHAVKNFILKVAGDAPQIVATVAKDAKLIEPIIEEFVPGSTAAINLLNALGDKVGSAIEDAGPAAAANGLSISLNQQEVADWQAVYAAAKAFVVKSPKMPTPPPNAANAA